MVGKWCIKGNAIVTRMHAVPLFVVGDRVRKRPLFGLRCDPDVHVLGGVVCELECNFLPRNVVAVRCGAPSGMFVQNNDCVAGIENAGRGVLSCAWPGSNNPPPTMMAPITRRSILSPARPRSQT